MINNIPVQIKFPPLVEEIFIFQTLYIKKKIFNLLFWIGSDSLEIKYLYIQS